MGFSKARIVGALLVAALSLGAGAPAAPTKERPPAREKVFQFALQNGMQVVVVPDHRAPVITQMEE